MAVTSVASSTTSAALLAAGQRRAVLIANSDANRLYILLDEGTASASNHSFSLAENESASVPQSYTGPINGVWAGDGSGYAHITAY